MIAKKPFLAQFLLKKKTQRHSASYDVTLRHVTSRCATLRHVASRDVTWRHVMSYDVIITCRWYSLYLKKISFTIYQTIAML